MMYGKPSPRKSDFGKILGFFILVLVISTTVFLKIYFYNASNSLNKPNKPLSSANAALNNNRSESLDQLNPTKTSAGPIKVVYELPEKQPVVYITIDDGWYPNEEVIKLMQQYHLPITTFLIEQAAQKHPDFWNEFLKSGGHIEDHTFSHPYLTHLSVTDQKNQISQPIDYLRQIGSPPDELRPPYGDFNSEVGQEAHDSGIKYIVMWDAEMENSKFTTRNALGLKAGDIILLHWVPGLDKELIELLNIIQNQNLGIADLTQALNGEPLTICWLKKPIPVPKPKATTSTGTSKIKTTKTSNTQETSTTTTGAFTIP
ncbi:putative xylanase/chitin deacetylase [Desulfosporosinus acidiphilus SJ4]|uniref:Putative xylanase/chitin deacetylase n=2 Tax=Desulfosporosinus TaxID=79206 RepID=I4D7L9_DESAJ|nr:putative xylanase/chitin deacetylase [Desulfosporosinus acidiphilus SJ4]